ncbi:7-cyano-7-deazaguanine/7-aminomethyl-7-deazaguanine transporter [Halomonas halocynthiae]|uniref:7-cyano-7-deazaguanine/7-aminomethyl-7- deazaguanine transporter n=1 Tax=Halomonas halocynthiae TaxID=176290 RepID=UPI000404D102|nr:7-cyano-7-deazaguanine/7-aminomethyl-7-deazaguanine transporter [Halomonas halocynthiae]
MLAVSDRQARRCLVLLVCFHIAVIAASNYLVQIPFTLFGVHTTWGAFSFPFIFLATDLTVRVFGKDAARQIVFRVMFPALIVSYGVSVIFPQGSFAGVNALGHWNVIVGRIALASFVAYGIGQLLDITVFDRLRRLRAWWVAPALSTVLGNLADTMAFFSVAFYASSDPFMAANWLQIAWIDYAGKLVISLVFFLPLYGIVLNWLSRRLAGINGGTLLIHS